MTTRALMPLAIFLILAGFLWKGLYLQPSVIPSVMIGKPVPTFNLSTVADKTEEVTEDIFKNKISLVNVWASWCYSCRQEHDFLLDVANKTDLQLLGINYKDNRENAKVWLEKLGNPFSVSVFDETGSLGIDWGVYGTPETFLVDAQGTIRFKYVGPIDQEIWNQVFLPEIKKIQG